MESLDLSVVIPCLNEVKTIAKVIAEAQQGMAKLGLKGEVVVSDNGSTDGSQEAATRAGARVVPAPIRGYGAALHFGILSARGKWVIFGDADMSYDFGCIERFKDFIREIDENHKKDMVLGSRLGGEIDPGAMPLLNRYLGTPALNLAIRMFFGLVTSDCNSGMRLVRREFYWKLPMRAPGMEWASEFLIKSKLMDMRYAEVPIHYRVDQRGRKPHLRRWRDGWRHLKTIVLLSPNRLILTPAFAVACFAVWAMAFSYWQLALMGSLVATTGFCLGLLVKLILHADGVRSSPVTRYLVKSPFAEILLGSGAFLTAVGFVACLLTSPSAVPLYPLAMISLAVGMVLMLTSFAWGVLITHTVDSLAHFTPENASGGGKPHSSDKKAA